MSRPYPPMLLSTGVRAAAMRTPDKIAVITRDRELPYRQVVERLNRIGNLGLGGLALARGDRVALLLPNGLEMIELTLGLSEVGIIAAILGPQSSQREIELIVSDSGARVLFTTPALLDQARAADLPSVERIVVVGEEYEGLLAAASDRQSDAIADETDIYGLHYTSGTTGTPKGVALMHRSRTLHMLLVMAANQGHCRPHMRGLAVAPLFNGAGFIYAVAPIWFGGTLVVAEKFDAEQTLRDLERHRITTTFLVPTHFHAMFNLGDATVRRYDASALEVIAAGAASLPQATKERIVHLFGPGRLFEGYGSTEAGGITSLRPEDQLRKKHCAGLPVNAVELRILDDDGREVPRGEVGEIVCRSPWLFRGYWDRPEETAAVLRDGWYYSGDLGHRDEDGYVYIVDRKKNVIISGGQNIYPREIEEVLYQHPAIAEVAVLGRKDDYWGEAVEAYVVARPGAAVTPDELKAHCKALLAPYKVPKQLRVIDSMPKGGSGKVLHRALKEMFP